MIKMLKFPNSRGFTLIELMIVCSIIGILVSLSIPNYLIWPTRARLKEAYAFTDEFRMEISKYYKKNRRFPKNNKELGIPDPRLIIGNYIKEIEVENGVIHVTLGNRIEPFLRGKYFSVRPYVVIGSKNSPISWGCGQSPAPEGMKTVGLDRTNVDSIYLTAIHCI